LVVAVVEHLVIQILQDLEQQVEHTEVELQEIVDLLQDQAQVQLVQQTLVVVVAVVVIMARHKVELVDLV
tara:strand:+ start:579 stop:788 length:210 start_codon:yes stop_codon:yes gene_type:complete